MLKAGNGVILRGGSEAIHSNLALAKCLHQVLEAHQLNPMPFSGARYKPHGH